MFTVFPKMKHTEVKFKILLMMDGASCPPSSLESPTICFLGKFWIQWIQCTCQCYLVMLVTPCWAPNSYYTPAIRMRQLVCHLKHGNSVSWGFSWARIFSKGWLFSALTLEFKNMIWNTLSWFFLGKSFYVELEPQWFLQSHHGQDTTCLKWENRYMQGGLFHTSPEVLKFEKINWKTSCVL